MLVRTQSYALIAAFVAGTNALDSVSIESTIQMSRLVQSVGPSQSAQYNDIPSICSGFEMLIDQIPNGRDNCECDGVSIDCLFRKDCEEGSTEPGCGDQVTYEISFAEEDLTVASCAHIEEGGFGESCVKVKVGMDLKLDECLSATYEEKPCLCSICDDRESIDLDCSEYEPLATSHCVPLGLSSLHSPAGPTFTGTAYTNIPPQSDPSEGETTSGAATKFISVFSPILIFSILALL